MTEATLDQNTGVPSAGLIPGALYSHYGIVRIAVDADNLQDLVHTDGTHHLPNEQTELLHEPGTPEWVDRMLRVRRNLLTELKNARADVARHAQQYENLGEALLEEAERRGWCGEYEEFAEEWGLPTRFKDYEVTVTLTIRAKSEEEAVEVVKDNVSLDSYSNGAIQSGPEFDANEA